MMAPPRTTLAALVALSSLEGMSATRLRRLLSVVPDPRELWVELASCAHRATRPTQSLLEVLGDDAGLSVPTVWRSTLTRLEPDRFLQAHRDANVKVLDATSVEFPTRLLDDPDPPAVLFVHGDDELLQTCGAAIVGTRRCTAYGRAVAKSCTDALADARLTTWSGLATGIDTVAHQRALERGTPTVAVLGGGIDHWYPAANRRLASSILARGAVVSERPMGYRARRWDFPSRNRLIAALSDATVVVESGERGGSLSTIEESDLRGHPILAVPGPITSDQSRGSNLLLDGRCQPLVEPSELVLAVASRLVASSGAGRSAAEVEAALQRCHVSLRGSSTDPYDRVIATLDPDACAVLAVLTHDALSTESVVLATTMSVGKVVGALSRLYSHGLVTQSDGWWVRSVGVTAGSRTN